ncbi:hypothetical protein [Ornithinimicrobium pekingense]|uniref:DUF4386 family protein n=1 Tax=Ornithinimicrobium pekingense TaxID=384677 RepID=A0ABQ2FFN3_9MICO|nr:hypothetical protein [Ornithinimicrobium pekingense]GGK82886.1 hypothetical protein GCM10011509_34230 [Ornithinimicrobium pekingense]
MAVALALAACVLMMGVIDLLTLPGWVDQQYEWEVPLEASWGALFTFLVAGAHLWVAVRPHTPWPAFLQLGICAVSLLAGAVAGADWRLLPVALGVVVSALVLWWLLGRPPIPSGQRPQVRPDLLAVAAAGLLLWVPYAGFALERSRAGVLGSVTQGVEHWPVQGATGLALVLGSFALALWATGRPLLRAAVSLSAVYIGMAELAYPDREGAMGSVVWGTGVTLWGLLVALLAVPRTRETTDLTGLTPPREHERSS